MHRDTFVYEEAKCLGLFFKPRRRSVLPCDCTDLNNKTVFYDHDSFLSSKDEHGTFKTAVESHPVRTEGNQIPDDFVNQLSPLTPVSSQRGDGGEVRPIYADSGISVALLSKQFTPIHHSEESHGTLQFPDFGPPSDPAGFESTQANCSPSSALRLSQGVPNSTGVTDSTPLDLNSIVEGSQTPTDAVSVSVVTIESCPTRSGSSLFAGPSLNRNISPTGSLIANASPLSSPVTLDLPTANVDEPLFQSCVTAEPSVTSLKDARSVEHSGISSFYKFFSGSAGSLVQRLCKVFMSADPAASGTGSKRLVDRSKESDCYIVSVSSPSRHSRLSRVSLSHLVHSLLHRIRDSVRSRCCRWKRARFIRKAVPSWTQSPRSGLLASFSNGWPSLSSSFSTPADECEPCLSPGLVELQPAQTTPSIRSLPPRFPTLLTYPAHDRSTLSDAETTLRRVSFPLCRRWFFLYSYVSGTPHRTNV
ncbi:uncharacterized protein DEA37_0004088 [Paragonimus westermani]|uniref:Uncharacterized protein n=1 Tax=Paragonimus westermani TaxID=34504 RepID=A0A5J4NIX7_9TREM|nr:uncharacterized protein DEA37_0004088 [Paragonimus westermani]